jgi:hypothetical protein
VVAIHIAALQAIAASIAKDNAKALGEVAKRILAAQSEGQESAAALNGRRQCRAGNLSLLHARQIEGQRDIVDDPQARLGHCNFLGRIGIECFDVDEQLLAASRCDGPEHLARLVADIPPAVLDMRPLSDEESRKGAIRRTVLMPTGSLPICRPTLKTPTTTDLKPVAIDLGKV